MSDIELVVKIPEEEYEFCKKQWDTECLDILMIAVKYGTPLPKGHGRLIDANKVEKITWQEPYYYDAINVLSEVRDKIRELPTVIEADKEEK